MNDIWQIGHGFTLNYGLRWEYASPFVERNGLAGMRELSQAMKRRRVISKCMFDPGMEET